jgi:pimeloyl-ACP methyl ester carboxylesterase
VLIPDMRGYGDSDKPAGNDGYDARSLAEEGRALIAAIGFGQGKPLIHAAHDMGALPALIWTADHPDEVAGLLYIEAPVMLGPVLRQVFSYTPQAMAQGSMWWWILPLAPGVPERLIVGNERAFLTWFYEGDHVVNHAAFTPEAVDEYLRTFAGKDGVLGSMGIYRAAFASIDQTEPLMTAKITVPGRRARRGEGARRQGRRDGRDDRRKCRGAHARGLRAFHDGGTSRIRHRSGHVRPEGQVHGNRRAPAVRGAEERRAACRLPDHAGRCRRRSRLVVPSYQSTP